MKIIISLAVVAAGAALLISQGVAPERVGPQRDGSTLLSSGWRLRPAGRQIELETFPMSTAQSPDGRFVVVLNGGYRPPSLIVLDAKSLAQVDRVPVSDAWLGVAFAPNGKTLYVGGGSRAAVFEFSFSEQGKLSPGRTFPLVADGQAKHEDFTGDVAVSPDGRLVYAAMLHRDRIAVINPLSGIVIERIPTGRRPYRILFPPDGKTFYVSSWADAAVYQHRAETGERVAVHRVGPHPTDMVWRDKQTKVEEGEEAVNFQARLFVAAANTNNVYVLAVSDTSTRILETINLSLFPNQPLGMTPSGLALSPDQSRLYAVCSDANTVAAVQVSGPKSRVLGFVPTGWYPTAARVLADNRVVVLNGRGSRSFPNPNGPQPDRRPAVSHLGIRNPGYVGNLQMGSASLIDEPSEAQLTQMTATVRSNSPYSTRVERGVEETSPYLPRNGGGPIEHVIYIVKENRTYDQVLGDLGIGNGDASLTLFGEESSPNHRKLAREFVLLDNFYVNADVSADGHNWSSAAIASDYVQKMWPNSYAGRRKHYDYEGGEPAALPPAGYLWNNALARGISLRNYGWWVQNKPQAAPPGQDQLDAIRDPALAPHTNRAFRGFDMDYTDVDRVRVFLTDLVQFERDNKMPQLILLRIGNDHTSGTAAGKLSPKAAMADNDLALGMLVEAVSKSKFWPKTAIFVLEDDAQNGPDHVDSHRSPAFLISPYTRGRGIDSTMYNTTSMLRTMERILNLAPMTHFDASAQLMIPALKQPDNSPFAHVVPKQSLTERNPQGALGAEASARMDFDEADRIDDDELNEILWRAIKKTEPPAPRRSIFSR